VACRAVSGAENNSQSGDGSPALTPDHQVVNSQTGEAISVSHSPREGVPGRRWIMVIDLAKCDGCGKCISACSKMHFVPPDRQWIKVLRMQDSEKSAPYFFPQPCYHCDNPPCTKVCPVDATFKRSDGVVLIDNERCIGCRFCMAACPYGARSFNWGKPSDPPEAAAKDYSPEQGYPRKIGTVEKCDFCPDMAAMGMLPACTSGCPMGAIYYGDENEDAVTNGQGETHKLSKLLLDCGGYRHMEELGTKPRVYYLPPRNRMYAPPGAPSKE
jgi:molybdopterin-containing oxidoreductase family iron-sulfur binding subunit